MTKRVEFICDQCNGVYNIGDSMPVTWGRQVRLGFKWLTGMGEPDDVRISIPWEHMCYGCMNRLKKSIEELVRDDRVSRKPRLRSPGRRDG